MAKTKTFKLPKYLRLVKGIMWMDIDGQNPSGIKLYRNSEMFVGRGNDIKSFDEIDVEHKKYGDEKYPEIKITKELGEKLVPEDRNKNTNAAEGAYGSIEVKKDDDSIKSWFCTDDIPNAKLSKILTAYNNGILVKHDPKVELKSNQELAKARDFTVNKDGDIVFSGANKPMYNLLMKKNFAEVKEFIIEAGSSAKQNLMDLYQYELKGFNKLSRPRGEVLDLVRSKLGKVGGGISAITVNDLDDEDTKVSANIQLR